MKTIKIKILLYISAFMFALSAIAFATNVKTVNADGAFVMTNGAYVRLSEENSGIRFTAKVTDESKDYYMLIVPKDLLTEKNITSDYVTQLEEAYPDQTFAKIACEPFTYKQELMIAGSLVNLKDNNYKREFVGIAYYTEGEGESLTYTYAAFDEGYNLMSNGRNIAKVASAYLNEGNTDGQDIAETMIEKAFTADGTTFGFSKQTQALTVSEYNYKALEQTQSFDLNVKLESNDPTVVEVNGSAIKAKANGTSVITAKIGDGSKFTASYTANVTTPSAKTWIDTDTAAYAEARNEAITYLDEYDGESGVLRLSHSTGDGGIGQLNLAFPASHYAEDDVVVLRIKGTAGVFVTYGNSSSWNFKNENCMTLTNEWKDYEFEISSLLSKSGGDDTLQSLSDSGMFYFNSATELYIADAYTYKKISLTGNVTVTNGKYVYTDNASTVLSDYTITDKKFIDAKGNTIALAENGEFTPVRTSTVYKAVYTATKNGKVVKAESSVTVYPKELSVYDFSNASIVEGAKNTVSYDEEESAVKIAGIGFHWMLRGKIFNADAVSQYTKVTFKVKTDSTTNGSFIFYAENVDMNLGYHISVVVGAEYAEYTVDVSYLSDNLTNVNNQSMLYAEGFTSDSNIWLKDIYLSGLKSDLPTNKAVYNFNDENLAIGSNDRVSYDTTEKAVKISVTGEAFINLLRGKMIANKAEAKQYTNITFSVKANVSPLGFGFFPEVDGKWDSNNYGYSISISEANEYVEYTFDITHLIDNFDELNNKLMIYIIAPENTEIYINNVYLSGLKNA